MRLLSALPHPPPFSVTMGPKVWQSMASPWNIPLGLQSFLPSESLYCSFLLKFIHMWSNHGLLYIAQCSDSEIDWFGLSKKKPESLRNNFLWKFLIFWQVPLKIFHMHSFICLFILHICYMTVYYRQDKLSLAHCLIKSSE